MHAYLHLFCQVLTLRSVLTLCLVIQCFDLLVLCDKGHVTRSNFSCNLQRNKCCVASCKKNLRVTPHFATAIVALRVARKVQRPSTFHNVARQVACV